MCCVSLQRTVLFSVSSRGHIWTKLVIKSILVCVRVRDTQAKPNCPQCVHFSENSCAFGTVFQRRVLFQSSREEEREN